MTKGVEALGPRAEFGGGGLLERLRRRFDKNGDGRLGAEERVEAMRQIREQRGAGGAP